MDLEKDLELTKKRIEDLKAEIEKNKKKRKTARTFTEAEYAEKAVAQLTEEIKELEWHLRALEDKKNRVKNEEEPQKEYIPGVVTVENVLAFFGE